MDFQKFLSLMTAITGFIGVFLISKGMLTKPSEILKGTYHYSACAWPSPEIIDGLSSNQANLIIGFISVGLAFMAQVIILFLPNPISFTKSLQMGIAICIISGLLFFVIMHLIQISVQNYYSTSIKKESIRNHLEERYNSFVRDHGNVKSVEDISQEYFKLHKKDTEAWKDYIVRIAGHVDWVIPKELDLDKIKEPY